MLPGFIPPQLATSREQVPHGAGWIHEVKHDGYRMLAYVGGGEARLLSRNNLDWSLRFRAVAHALGAVRAREAVLDGEVVSLDARGHSDFSALQAMVEQGKRAPLHYLVFDLLWLDGRDLRALPLVRRKARLRKLLPKRHAVLRYVDHVTGAGLPFFAGACERGLEGMISKRADAPYRSGRTLSWIKVKCVDAKEFAVGGYIPSERRGFFKSLVLGEPSAEGLVYRGQVGGGFTEALGRKIAGLLAPLETDASPFRTMPWELRGKARWVRPEYVVMVRFTEITREGVLRHPRFLRIRHVSEPGVAQHLRSRTLGNDRPKKRRRARPRKEPPKPDPAALTAALRKSLRGRVPQRGASARRAAG